MVPESSAQKMLNGTWEAEVRLPCDPCRYASSATQDEEAPGLCSSSLFPKELLGSLSAPLGASRNLLGASGEPPGAYPGACRPPVASGQTGSPGTPGASSRDLLGSTMTSAALWASRYSGWASRGLSPKGGGHPPPGGAPAPPPLGRSCGPFRRLRERARQRVLVKMELAPSWMDCSGVAALPSTPQGKLSQNREA